MGEKGIWVGFIVGTSHQIIAYATLIYKTDWDKAHDDATQRISRSSIEVEMA